MSARRRSIVLCVVVLILAGTVLPATAIEPAVDSQSALLGPAPSNADSSPTGYDTSPLERKRAAIATIESMEVGWRLQARQRSRAVDRLNGTLTDYRDPYRVSSASVFRDDRRALGALARIAWINATAAEAAADHVVAADFATVNTTIDDAGLALERTRGRIDEPRDRRRAERAIDRAVRARDRSLRALNEDDWSPWRSTKRRRAIVHLGVAWLHAQHALEVLDRSSDPVLTIETRSDPPRNRSTPVVRTIRGSVADVRAYELGNVSVAVNGTRVGSTPLDATPAPGRNASFAVNVTLDRSIAEVALTVSEGDSSEPASWTERRGRWHRFGRHGDRGGESHRSSERFDRSRSGSGSKTDRPDRATVRFDGDGLPDRFEVDTAQTDPLDPDSDSRRTDADEAADGRLDGGEDFDGDRLITYAEYELGTDPFANDTDADGLSDRFEASHPALVDPVDADTDDDGVHDGGEDFDGDGLTTADEYAHDTSVASPDSDGDGLEDGEEVHTHATSPIDDDTDGDGLGDAEELRLGIDPLMADTDGDGVRDGNETYTTTATDEVTGVHVSLVGQGDVGSQVSVENVTQRSGSDFLAAPVFRVENRTEFEAATVTIPIDGDSRSADVDNLSVYKWSPEDGGPWHPVNSTVDRRNGTASATVSSFSFFTVMEGPAWEEAITDTIAPSWPHQEAFDDLDGWDVEGDARVEDGTLVVSGREQPQAVPDIVVAADGSGDFERIQPAVDAASDGDTILVRDGRYPEEVVIDVSVDVVGENATLDGSGLDRGAVGVRLVDGRPAALDGLTIEDYEVGVLAAGTSTDARLSRLTLLRNEVGVDAEESAGNWTLESVTASGNVRSGVEAAGSTGDWSISDADLSENGWNGIEADRAEGNWTVEDTVVTRSGLAGVSSYRSMGRWSLSGVDVSRNDGIGLDAYRASGSWRLTDVELSRNGGEGIDAFGAAGHWTLRNLDVTSNDGNGIDALGATEDWTMVRGNYSRNAWTGVVAGDTTGTWEVTDSSIVGNGDDGFDAYGSSGTVRIAGSRLYGNGDADVYGPDDPLQVDARGNWWGRQAGPADGQTEGMVLTDPYCTSIGCPGFDASVSMRAVGELTTGKPLVGVDGAGHPSSGGATDRAGTLTGVEAERSSVVSREVTLSGGASAVRMLTRLRRHGPPGAPASIRVVGDTGTVTVAEFSRNTDTFVETSANLTPYAGETLAVEIVASTGVSVEVDWIDFVVDTDGDGLRDAIERADLGMPTGPRPGAPLASLDPTNPDTDGDGLLDGEELTGVTVERVSTGPVDSLSFRAEAADADPTVENSDGGGLNDSAEVEAGSDPFVLETLVIGYAIPTMTHGPNDTLEDRQPMTVGEANGLQTGSGRDSNLIAWPSRQFFDPLFCIKELTGGPGCAPEWMIGVEPKEDKLYVFVPFVVYAESSARIEPIPYQMSFDSPSGARFVKGENTGGSVAPGRSQRGYVVYELPERRAFEEAQPRAFRSIGQVTFESELTGTIFERKSRATVSRGYSVSTSTLLPATEQMLEDTQYVLENGMNVALAAEAGATVAIKTGSRSRGALVFLYELATSQVDTPPKSIEDVAMKASLDGIGSFKEQIGRSEKEIYRDIFGDGVVRPVGPTVIRQS